MLLFVGVSCSLLFLFSASCYLSLSFRTRVSFVLSEDGLILFSQRRFMVMGLWLLAGACTGGICRWFIISVIVMPLLVLKPIEARLRLALPFKLFVSVLPRGLPLQSFFFQLFLFEKVGSGLHHFKILLL